ncbi:HAMP domain-containing methyl-accepting chemotaxis protein [Methylomonas rivi]|uniref:Methyl-accepting chemotaxis protein n=1 Tax=Methylomonas rivi TaxID=2952226 RepID=A0ABT1U5J6_9GAMM|nr:methyl-accepting chemotaxis protein [Methylomonas sp. WSC-6]MCQ8129137.1 methyl-accepting chemotaxis protein [Methylomonas sp. WSC-6]
MKITVAQKMTTLVATAVIGLVALAWQGQSKMQDVYDKTNFTNINCVPGILMLSRATESLGRLRIRMYRHVLSDDAASKAKVEESLRQSRDIVDKSLKDYESTIFDEKDRQLWQDNIDSFNAYLKGVDQILAYSNQNKLEQAKAALAEYAPQAERVNKAFNAHMDYNAELAKKSAEEAVATKGNATFVANLITGLVVALTALLGFFVTRNLLKQLGGEPDFAAELANKIAVGDLSTQIAVKANDKTSMMAAMQNMARAIQALVNDAGLLAQAGVEGRLSTRADAGKHQGDFRRIVEGVNNTLDAVIGPLNVAADYVEKIAKGEVPAKITDAYNGDFNVIKNNLNTCIDAVNALINDAALLSEAAAEGRLDTRADAGRHQGDYRRIVEGVNATLDGVIGPLNRVKDVLFAMEQGDMTQQITEQYRGQLEDLRYAANNTVKKLAQTIAEVVSAADQLGNASEQISSTSQSLSQAASEQAAGVEETSASIEQMAASIDQNAENAKITDGMAGKASKEAGEGGVAVKQTVAAMKDIATKIGIIDDIAYQTNMLALNAAIEAARAGDHGKGFAVVAAEVRKLAERSQIAAQEIGELAESSVKTAETAGRLLDEIVPSIAKTSDLVQEIAAASQEQSQGVGQVNTAMNQMNQITQQNASASEQLAATSEEMTSQAEQLQSLMSFFKIGNAADTRGSAIKVSRKSDADRLNLQVTRTSSKNEFDLAQFERF